jgi:hypothetical protein
MTATPEGIFFGVMSSLTCSLYEIPHSLRVDFSVLFDAVTSRYAIQVVLTSVLLEVTDIEPRFFYYRSRRLLPSWATTLSSPCAPPPRIFV